MDYKFTVFTPCYNGEKTIHRVFESMNAQTYTNWEWIIINDGSTDNSDSVIKELISESKWGGANSIYQARECWQARCMEQGCEDGHWPIVCLSRL